jgi:dipeptidyl aminopeptidase/acylaminoacyl peptidase
MHKLVLLIAVTEIALAQKRPIELKDYYKLEWVSAPAMSPDGQKVAYVKTRIVEAENTRQNEVWVSTAARTFRLSGAAANATKPRWSADGKLLAFDVAGGAPWFVRMDGGDSKPYQIRGVEGSPVFSPDGKWIAYTKKVTPSKVEKRQVSEFDTLIDERFKGRMYDWMNFRFDGRGYLADPRNPNATPPLELFVVAANGGEPRQITHVGVDVLTPSWRPDSQALAFTADLHLRDEYAYERADLWSVTLQGQTRMLTQDDGWHHQAPAWSPDGEYIAVLREEGLKRVIASKWKHGSPIHLVLVPARGHGGEEPRNLTAGWDNVPSAPQWSVDGKSIYFESEVKGTEHLFRVAVADSRIEQVTQGDRVLPQVSIAGNRMAYTSSTTDRPVEVYTASLPAAGGFAVGERKVSSVSDVLLATWQLSKVERIHYDSKDGTPIDGWVVLPPGYEQGRSNYPMVLTIHGGPHAAYTSAFAFKEQLLAAAGYIVLYTNPRGSTGYGEKFRWGTWGGWGERDYEDVMAGVDYVLKHYRVDPRRLGVTGYSYGGFLTNWIIGHTTRFAAAVVGAGPSDWISNYGTGDIPRTKETEFLGTPWEENARAVMLAHSPVLFADKIQTPTLFVHGEADERVPIAQGEEMYTALKKRRVPAKFVRYPGEYHGGWSPWDVVHSDREELLWWRQYLGKNEPAHTQAGQ